MDEKQNRHSHLQRFFKANMPGWIIALILLVLIFGLLWYFGGNYKEHPFLYPQF